MGDGKARARKSALLTAMSLVAGLTSWGAPPGVQVATAATSTAKTVGSTPVSLGQPSDPFLGRITPTATAASQGMFGPQIRWPLIPLQAVLLADGHLVTYGSPVGIAAQKGLAYDEWNPALGGSSAAHDQTPSMHDYDSFCSGMQRLPDGRLVMVGGNATMSTMIFNPATDTQTSGRNLARQRWYATTLRLPDDRILVLGGANYYNTTAYKRPTVNSGVATIPEVGSGTGAWSSLTGANSAVAFGAQDNRWWYPRAYNAPNGQVVGISANRLWMLNPSGRGSLRSLATLPTSIGISGSSVMYKPGKILLAGGGQKINSDSVRATNAATIVDVTTSTPKVARTTSMSTARNWVNLTVMANGEVLANGGTKVGTLAGASNAANRAEFWNPWNRRWAPAASAQRIRTYHSVSLLMPSGAVFTGGGGIPGPEDNMNAELYYPRYLFTKGSDGKVRWANRPQVKTLAGQLNYGGKITLGMSDTRAMRSVSLISLAAVTHSYNVDQRRVELTMTQKGSSVTATLPTSRNIVPPGSYLLEAVDTRGVPAPAQIVTITKDGRSGTVTVYEPTQATGGGEQGDTTSVGVVPLTPGTAVGLEPFDQWGYRVRHVGGTVSTAAASAADPLATRRAASFVVRTGLGGDGTVSFEAVDQPGHYLHAASGKLELAPDDGSDQFAEDASFTAVTGLTGQFTSFRLVSDPSLYVRQVGTTVVLRESDGSDLARQQSTFAVRPAMSPGSLPSEPKRPSLSPSAAPSEESASPPSDASPSEAPPSQDTTSVDSPSKDATSHELPSASPTESADETGGASTTSTPVAPTPCCSGGEGESCGC